MIINWIGRLLGSKGDANGNGSVDDLRWYPEHLDANGPLGLVVDFPEMLNVELERARRYERSLSIVVLWTTPLGDEDAVQRRGNGIGREGPEGPPQVVSLLAASGLREILRESDILCFKPIANRFVLALAESDTESANGALERIRSLFHDRLRLEVCAGTSRFPEDGLTLESLIAEATARAERPSGSESAVLGQSDDAIRETDRQPHLTPTSPEAASNG